MGGWHTETLTEDTEMSFKMVAKGRKIAWANEAVIYDEQPTDFVQAWNQRLRWGAGTVQCLKVCAPKLLTSKYVSPALIDATINLAGMPILLLSLISTVLEVIKALLLPTVNFMTFLQDKILFALVVGIFTMLQATWVVRMEKKGVKKMWKGIVTYPIFLVVCFFVNITAFFNTKIAWKPIKHVSTVKINEIQKD